MRAFVCVKVGPTRKGVRYSRSRGVIDSTEAEREVSLADRFAVQLAKSLGPERLTAVSWAPEEDEALLKQMVALGADDVLRIATPLTEEAAHDPLVVAWGLAEAIRPHSPDVVVLGAASIEHGRGAVGPMLAEYLDLPCVTQVRSASRTDEGVRLECREGDFLVTIEAPTPLVITALPEGVTLKKPSMLHLARAAKAEVQTVEVEACSPVLRPRSFHTTEARRRLRERIEGRDVAETARLLLSRLRDRRVLG